MARPAAEFLGGFVLPLVAGGPLRVGRPIGEKEIRHIEQDLPHAAVPLVEVDEARTAAVAEIVVQPPSFVFDSDELHLAAAVHNLLFLEHPQADGWMTLQSRVERVRQVARRFAFQPPASDRYTLLARHGLLHNLFAITRSDVLLSWWTGSARYVGATPSRRLRLWPNVRRVREQTTIAGYADLLGDPDVEQVVAEILRLSPLTDLLAQPRPGPPLDWGCATVVLRDAELARAVAYRALRPADGDAPLAVAARYAAGLESFLERHPAETDVRAVASLLVHLSGLLALGEARDRDPDAPSPLLATALAPERAAQRARGLATFVALPDALAQVDSRLAMPPGILDDARVARRWRRHRAQVRDGVGAAVIDSLAQRLRKALGARSAMVE
jgi:hypothetical protein